MSKFNVMDLPVEIIILISFFLTIFGVVYIVYSTRHKERMAMIENGIDADFMKPSKKKGNLLKNSIVTIGASIGMFVGYILEDFGGMDEIIYFISTALFSGISLFIYYFINKAKERENEEEEIYF